MSNGVEVIVANSLKEAEKSKHLRIDPARENEKITTLAPSTVQNNVRMTIAPEDQAHKNNTLIQPKRRQQSLISSSTSTAFEPYMAYRHENTKIHPYHNQRHNYIIKTCYTTFTYLTTTIQKMRTTVSTYETVVSTVTTEPIEVNKVTKTVTDIKPTKTHLVQFTKTAYETPILTPKIEKRVDEFQIKHDILQPSEVNHGTSCSMASCPCTITYTESLNFKTKTIDSLNDDTPLQLKRSPLKPTKYGSTIIDIAPTTYIDFKKDKPNKQPYKNQNQSNHPLSEKVVQKYTEVINDPSRNPIKMEESNLNIKKPNSPLVDLNKQNNKINFTKEPDDKRKPIRPLDDKKDPTKINKNTFEVTNLLKLGIKSLAPMIQKMQWMDLIRGQEPNKQTTTTIKPVTVLTPYIVNKRQDEIQAAGNDQKINGNTQFPIYIPVDEKDIETAESQNVFYNSTLQQNLSWNSQNSKNPKVTLNFGKPIHESPLLNGGIPISPGEIITANSDVIVGKPAVGGPNIGHINKPNNNLHQNLHIDSHPQSSNFHDMRIKPPLRGQGIKQIPFIREDDSYDLRPPMVSISRPPLPSLDKQNTKGLGIGVFDPHNHGSINSHNKPQSQKPKQSNIPVFENHKLKTTIIEQQKPHNLLVDHVGGSIHSADSIFENHGRPTFLDYIPALNTPANYQNYIKNNLITRKTQEDNTRTQNNLDKNKVFTGKLQENIQNTQHFPNKFIKESQEITLATDFAQKTSTKPLLVDIQPSRVANVIIPHGSTTALIFAGSSEPHKNGEYIDDPLPYPEPGYFGSFSIDAPHLTSVQIGAAIPNKSNIQINREKDLTQSITFNHDSLAVDNMAFKLNKDTHPSQNERWKYEINKNKPLILQGAINGKLPPPISNQESHIQFGPHTVIQKPGITNKDAGQPPRNQAFNNVLSNVRTTTADYEVDLAVPPPPPSNFQIQHHANNGIINVNSNNEFKSGIGKQHPFMTNIQSNINNYGHITKPSSENQENNNSPPKITSEIYFASSSQNQKVKPITLNIPANQHFNRIPSSNIYNIQENTDFDKTKFSNSFNGGFVTLNAGSKINIRNPVLPSNNLNMRPNLDVNSEHYSIPQNGGFITLNADASVFNPHLPEQTISGSNNASPHRPTNKIPIIHNTQEQFAGIQIGNNLAIKVEPQTIDEYKPINFGTSNNNFKSPDKGPEIIIGGNNWKAGISNPPYENTNDVNNMDKIPDNVLNGNQKVHVIHPINYKEQKHNFVRHEEKKQQNNSKTADNYNNVRLSTETFTNLNKFNNNQKPNLQNNIKFNSFDAIPENNPQPLNQKNSNNHENKNDSTKQRPIILEQINNEQEKKPDIKEYNMGINSYVYGQKISNEHLQKPPQVIFINKHVESTTHKIIPITFNYEEERYGTANKNIPVLLNPKVQLPMINTNWNHQRPVSISKKPPSLINEFMVPPTLTSPTYITSNYNNNQRPTYETSNKKIYEMQRTTFKPILNTIKYPSDETKYLTTNKYKTIDEKDYDYEQSVKVSILTSTPHTLTNEVTVNFKPIKHTNQSTDEILIISENDYNVDRKKPIFNADDNTGSQTEKPFYQNSYKETPLILLPDTKQTTQASYNVQSFSQMAPRPFSISEQTLINKNQNNDVHRPKPFHKTQETIENHNKLILNIGEIEKKPQSYSTLGVTEKTTRPVVQIPIVNIKENNPTYPKISTSSPFRITNTTTEKLTTLSTFADEFLKNHNDTNMIISNLSPPPLTTSGELPIVGMSPPPKTPTPKIPTKEYTKYTDISTFRPSYTSHKNQQKRPGDYYRITSRPFSRFTTPSSNNLNRHKVTSDTTITRIVVPSRSSIPSWKNPVRVETKLSPNKQTIQIIKSQISPTSIINTAPLEMVGSAIMHPDIYPEETIPIRSSIPLQSDINITPDSVHKPIINPTVVHYNLKSSVIPHLPSIIQTSENFYDDNIVKKTETLKISNTVKDINLTNKQIKTSENKFVIPNTQSIINFKNDKATIKLVHHAGNEIKQSDDILVKNTNPLTTFTTTVVQPASTIMTTRFVTLTHTLTVTQTQTSIVTPEVGSKTQTLVLTNTHTSTVVDVVTEIHTSVQPVTIVQTITKHVSITTLPSWETKYPKVPIEPTFVRQRPYKTEDVIKLDDVSLSSDEEDFIIKPDNITTDIMSENTDSNQDDNNTFFVVMNKSQSGGSSPNIKAVIEDVDSDEPVRNEEVGNDGVSHVLLGEILLAGTPYLETSHAVSPTGVAYGKECQPDCKASRNERCQRMHGLMKCVCRPGFARMFPDRPCKPTYTYSMKLALSRYGRERLFYQDAFADQNTKEFQDLAMATHEGINRMVMQSDLRDVYHGVHINGFQPVKIPTAEGLYMNGVMNDFYVQLSDNAHETRLKEVIEKYLRHNNYSLGGTDVYAANELIDKLEVGDFNECMSTQFHDCSEHAECFNLRATYTCSCKEGYADLSVNPLYPGRLCSAEPVGCEKCNYHGTCYTRDNSKVLCECFQWYSGESCQINLKVILISLSTLGAVLFMLLLICLILTCIKRKRPNHHMHSERRSQIPPNVMTSCIGNLPSIHQGGLQSSKMNSTIDRRALIQEKGNDSGGESSSIHNVSLPYIPAKKASQTSHRSGKIISSNDDNTPREKKPFTLMIPRAKYHPAPTTTLLINTNESRDSNINKRKSSQISNNETKLLSYLDAGPGSKDNAKRKQSNESSNSMNKYSTGALISAGFKVSTTVMAGIDRDSCIKDIPDDESSVAKSNTLPTLDMQSQFNSLRKAYSQEDINDWTDAERRIGELTMSEARSFDGTLVKPSTKLIRSTTGSNKSSAHYTQHEANTMAERDLGSTFLLPHVHLYKPDMGSDVSEFDSL